MKADVYKARLKFLQENNITTADDLTACLQQAENEVTQLAKQRTILNVRKKNTRSFDALAAEAAFAGFEPRKAEYDDAKEVLDTCGIPREALLSTLRTVSRQRRVSGAMNSGRKIHNLKQAAKTMNFLTEHKIEQYADLVSRIEEMAAESGQAADALKNAEKRLAEMAVLIKNVSTYQKTKPVYDAYRKARNREKYRAGQEQAIILHEAAVRSLKAAGIAKLPNLAALQSSMKPSKRRKEALYADYGKLKRKSGEYGYYQAEH